MRLIKWIFHEVKIQWKNGFYYLYIGICLFYMVALSYVPQAYKQLVGTVLLLTDPTFLGMIFVGGILLLEKNQGIPKGIGVSPLGSMGYILGKVVSLLIIALITGICIMKAASLKMTFSSIVALVLSGSLFTMIGILVGSFSRSINNYICLITLGNIPFAIPVLVFIITPDCSVFGFIPTTSTLGLISGTGNALMHIGYLLIWTIGIYFITKYVVEHEIFVR